MSDDQRRRPGQRIQLTDIHNVVRYVVPGGWLYVHQTSDSIAFVPGESRHVTYNTRPQEVEYQAPDSIRLVKPS